MSKPWACRRVAILGSGVMGAQIAAHCVNAKIEVLLYDLPAKEGSRNALAEKAIELLSKLKPAPLAFQEGTAYIRPANYDDDLDELKSCDWVIEAISERLDWKLALYQKIGPYLAEHALLSTNTSGLSIEQLAEGLPEALGSRFLGVHFFNPPRYMALVELIPHTKTDAVRMDSLEAFLVLHLGKGVIRAKDTPNFIGNRIGVFSILSLLKHAERFNIAPDVVDQLTGSLLGRPKSATYRTLDVVGLDTFSHVVRTMEKELPEDPWHSLFSLPNWMFECINKGFLGQKTKKGIYEKRGEAIWVYDPEVSDYRAAVKKADPVIVECLKKPWHERIAVLKGNPHPQAQFVWACMRDLWHYCAVHLSDIAHLTSDVDLAMRWGYGWEEGPFESWQAAGWEYVLELLNAEISRSNTQSKALLPAWVSKAMKGAYEGTEGYDPAKDVYRHNKTLAVYDQLKITDPLGGARPIFGKTLFENEGLRLWSEDDDVLIASFNTHRHCISLETLKGLQQAVVKAEAVDKPLVVWQTEGHEFTVGANLKQAMESLKQPAKGVLDIQHFVQEFQNTMHAVQRSQVPVVLAVQGLVLGGGCELVLHAAHTVAAIESYIGLVETGVGLIPAAGGCKELAFRASLNAGVGLRMPWVEKFFKQIAMAEVSGSAYEARRMGYLSANDTIVMNPAHLLWVAKKQAIALHQGGYRPNLPRRIRVEGRAGIANLKTLVVNLKEGGFISEHDQKITDLLAEVLCGGMVDSGSLVDEAWMFRLELQAFMDLIQTEKTVARVMHTLKTGKPLRN